MLRKKFCLAVCLTVLLLAAAAWAATVNYGGTGPLVQNSPVSGVTVDSTGDGTGVGSVIPDEPSHNTVTVDYTPGAGNIDPYRVFGGLSDTDAVSENTATLMDGLITGDFFGGYDAGSSGAFSNKAVIRGGTVGNGDADLSAAAGASQNGDASGNALEWLGGVAKVDIVGGVSGAGKASGNSVLIDATGGAHTEDIYGGHSNQSEASFNSVTLKAGTVKNIEGGRSAGAVNNNRVVITGGHVAGDGASAIVDGGHASTGSAESNTVILDGDLVFDDTDGQDIYGGYSAGGDAQYNTVILRGIQDLQHADLYGGRTDGGGASAGNILNLVNFTGKVKSIQDFQEIKFVLPGRPPRIRSSRLRETQRRISAASILTSRG